MRILALDPGNTHTGWTILDHHTRQPLDHGKTPNHDLLTHLRRWTTTRHIDHVAIEMIAAYGMTVGAEVFDTCVWIGRYAETCNLAGVPHELVYRRDVKLHHCGTTSARDSNVTRALADRFAYGQPNYGKGTKAAPGWFHGFRADVWQAYALGVFVADRMPGPVGDATLVPSRSGGSAS